MLRSSTIYDRTLAIWCAVVVGGVLLIFANHTGSFTMLWKTEVVPAGTAAPGGRSPELHASALPAALANARVFFTPLRRRCAVSSFLPPIAAEGCTGCCGGLDIFVSN